MNFNLIDELIGYLEKGTIPQKSLFCEKMRGLPEIEQDEIEKELSDRGFKKLPNFRREKQTRINLSKDEWTALAETCMSIRKNDPAISFSEMVKKAQNHLPKEKRRQIVKEGAFKPLIDIMKSRMVELFDAEKKVKALKPQEKQPSKEDILKNLTEEDLQNLSSRVLPFVNFDELIAVYSPEAFIEYLPLESMFVYAFEQFSRQKKEDQNSIANLKKSVDALSELVVNRSTSKPVAPHIQPTAVPIRKPKVLILGLLPGQQQIILKSLSNKADITCVDKNRKADINPNNQNVVVLWANKIDHATQEQIKGKIDKNVKLIIHHGGISTMIEAIEKAI